MGEIQHPQNILLRPSPQIVSGTSLISQFAQNNQSLEDNTPLFEEDNNINYDQSDCLLNNNSTPKTQTSIQNIPGSATQSPTSLNSPDYNNNTLEMNNNTNNNDDEIRFFNNHEYAIQNYDKLNASTVSRSNSNNSNNSSIKVLTATHFENCYVIKDSIEYNTTRIVRVPRDYSSKGDLCPIFSTYLPGTEPGAINEYYGDLLVDEFIPRGVNHLKNKFGYSSISPLNLYLSKDEFQEIIFQINNYCNLIFNPFQFKNLLFNSIAFLTLWIGENLFTDPSKKALKDLDLFIDKINEEKLKLKQIKLISPRRSGFLSLDFQIPRP